MKRRHFLQFAGSFVASAALPVSLTACSHRGGTSYTFPHGVASGDPRPTSVVIWSRLEPSNGREEKVWLTAEASLDEAFSSLVLQQSFEVGPASDYTLRVMVEDLQPDTVYYYRFSVGEEVWSITGRTLTAPSADDDKAISFAFVSCQDYSHGFYSAYRQMLNDDLARSPEDQIRFVLHLGDFIYETIGDPLQIALDESLNPLSDGLIDDQGKTRRVAPFPDGALTENGVSYANTLEDYRHLYKQYLNDPDLQAARARWPFIHIWDDHEFSDDCWQTEANYSRTGSGASTDEPSQPRKVAANQAWFEYMPVNLLRMGDVDTDLIHASEFQFASVQSSPNTIINDDNLVTNQDNLAAIDTITIYRSFRIGKLLELVLTDNRSYRSDHAIPEEISGNSAVFFHPRIAVPLDLVQTLDAGRTANNGDPDTFIFAGGVMFNPRRNVPPGTILGVTQKQWWKETLRRSDARWKVWGNSVPLMRFLINLSALGGDLPDVIMSADSWDGYPAERKELMSFIVDEDIKNVVSLAGDVHAHFAGIVMDDYDSNEAPQAAMAEFVCGSISSISQFAAVEKMSRRDVYTETEKQFRELITYDARDKPAPGSEPIVRNLNNTLLNGVAAAAAVAATNSVEDLNAAKNPGINSHLRYADTDGHGYGLVRITNAEMVVDLVTVSSVAEDRLPGVTRTVRFTLPYTDADPQLSDPDITGVPPFPF